MKNRFFHAVDQEFKFLVTEHGFCASEFQVGRARWVEFRKPGLRITVTIEADTDLIPFVQLHYASKDIERLDRFYMLELVVKKLFPEELPGLEQAPLPDDRSDFQPCLAVHADILRTHFDEIVKFLKKKPMARKK